MEITLIIVIAVALFFDFTNGFHDTANAIATIVSTKALSPRIAVIGAALLNFAGAFISLHVAATIAGGIINPEAITLPTVLAGLVGAIVWNLITWRIGMPSSSSHALVGGVAGAAAMATGWNVINWQGLEQKVLIPSLVSPFVGLLGALLLIWIIIRVFRRLSQASSDKLFRRLQLFSGGFVALMHGTNDAQKTMGIIALALVTVSADKTLDIPFWVILASATAMAAGTWVGGWRIIQTMGEKITKLDPRQGFAAQTSTAATLGVTSQLGFPVSTTQTISGAIVGAGVGVKGSVVNWKVIKNILLAWVFTVPLAGLLGVVAELVTKLPYGTGILFLVLVVIAAGIYVTRTWTWETNAQMRMLLSLVQRVRRRTDRVKAGVRTSAGKVKSRAKNLTKVRKGDQRK